MQKKLSFYFILFDAIKMSNDNYSTKKGGKKEEEEEVLHSVNKILLLLNTNINKFGYVNDVLRFQ